MNVGVKRGCLVRYLLRFIAYVPLKPVSHPRLSFVLMASFWLIICRRPSPCIVGVLPPQSPPTYNFLLDGYYKASFQENCLQ